MSEITKKYTCNNCGLQFTEEKQVKYHKLKCDVTLTERINTQDETTNKLFKVFVEMAKDMNDHDDKLKIILKKLEIETPKVEVPRPTESREVALTKIMIQSSEQQLEIMDPCELPDKITVDSKNTNLFIFTYHNKTNDDGSLSSSMFQWKRGEWVSISHKIVGKLMLSQNLTQLL